MMPKAETSGNDAAEEWSILHSWEKDPAIKAERRNIKSKFDCVLETTNFFSDSITQQLIVNRVLRKTRLSPKLQFANTKKSYF